MQSARDTIAGIRDSVLVIAMPDISGSLRLLRQFNTLADAAAPAAPARPEDADEDDEAAELPDPEQDQ